MVESRGVPSKGRASDSSYAVSGTSSAGTARDTPKARSTKITKMEHGLFIKDPFPQYSVPSPQGVCVSTGGNCSSGRREKLRAQFYYCSTAAAKKNDRMCMNLHTARHGGRYIAISLIDPDLSDIAFSLTTAPRKTAPQAVSLSRGTGGGEDCGTVSSASSQERMATRSGATTTPPKTSGYLSRRVRAERRSEMVPAQLPREKGGKGAATWISPCKKVFSVSCAGSH